MSKGDTGGTGAIGYDANGTSTASAFSLAVFC